MLLPFGYRQAAPWLASALSSAFGLSLNQSFAVIALFSLAVLLLCLESLWRDLGIQHSVVFTLALFLPAQALVLRDVFLPDLPAAAGLAALLLALRHEHVLLAVLALFFLLLIREAAILVAAVLALFALRDRDWAGAALYAGATLAALIFLGLLTQSLENVHGLPSWLYSLLKGPVNLLSNLLGLKIFADTFGDFCHKPMVLYALDGMGLPDRVKEVGICYIDFATPFFTLVQALSVAGAGPALLIAAWRFRRRLRSDVPTWAMIAGMVGALFYLLAPASGVSVERLFTYGWPLWFLFLPALFGQPSWSRAEVLRLTACHLLAGWCAAPPYLFEALSPRQPAMVALAFGGALLGNLLAYCLAARKLCERCEPVQSPSRSVT